MRTYVFMYILGKDADRVKDCLGQHIRYWKNLELDHFQNGPFADKSGGMIIFSASSTEQAEKTIAQDPLLKKKTIQHYWLKEWVH